MTRGMRKWFYASFGGRICMVMICDERARVRYRETGRKEGGCGQRCSDGVEETAAAVAAIGAARFVYRG